MNKTISPVHHLSMNTNCLKLILLICTLGTVSSLAWGVAAVGAEVKESDLWRPDGSAKVLWKDSNEEQKALSLELGRQRAEYIIANQGKRFAELKEIPRFLQPRQKPDPNAVYFTTSQVVGAYISLGNYDIAVKLAKADYASNPESAHGPYKLRSLMGLLSDTGRHQEALDLYQKYLEELLPGYSKEDFATKKTMPNNPTYDEAMRYGEELKKKAKSASPAPDTSEESIKMHRAFHSKNRRDRLEALEFYRKHGVRFMLRKGSFSNDPEVKDKAKQYLKALEGK